MSTAAMLESFIPLVDRNAMCAGCALRMSRRAGAAS